MRNILSVLLMLTYCLVCCFVNAQIFDFEGGTIPKQWNGTVENFQITSSNELQLNAPNGSTYSSLYWNSLDSKTCMWNFLIRYDFAASTSSYALFYMYSLDSNFKDKNNISYYLKIGGVSGNNDQIELYYQKGTIKYKILESRLGIVGGTKVNCRIQITKSPQGIWLLSTDATGGFDYKTEASATHWEQNDFMFSGFSCTYSSTRKDKFFWSDIVIQIPFSLLQYSFKNDSILNMYFNKSLLKIQAPNITSTIKVDFKIQINDSALTIIFNHSISPNTYEIVIENLLRSSNDDVFQQRIVVIKEPTYYVGQLRISEFMSDPSPSYGLPEIEWIEIMNTSDQTIDLKKISVSDPTTRGLLKPYLLEPKEVVVVCANNGCNSLAIKKCIETSTFPNLNNDGDSIFIWANDNILIDFVNYTSAMLEKDFRTAGGYAIARNEFPGNCELSQKLAYSNNSKGGSPGLILDFKCLSQQLFTSKIISKNEVDIEVNGIFTYMRDSINTTSEIIQVRSFKSNFSTIHRLQFSKEFELGDAYHFKMDSFINCKNQHQYIGIDLNLIIPKNAQPGDVFINEVLYNPFSGGVDFIEFYNLTSKYIEFRNGYLINNSRGISSQFYFSKSIQIEPYAFTVITTDTTELRHQYPNSAKQNLTQVSTFLSLPDTGGQLFWIAASGDTLDRIRYGDDFQNLLIRNTEGYSLEKIDAMQSTFSASNWTTSATNATPGYQNSQFLSENEKNSKPFYCSPCHVTTNVNGLNDFVRIHIEPSSTGSFGSIDIFDLSGEKVSELVVNQLLGLSNVFQWNGLKQNGEILRAGIYIAVAKWWSHEGKVYSAKIPISTSQY